MDTLAIVFLVIAILAIIAAVFAFVWPIIKKNGAENKASKIVSDANVKAEQILANAKLEGKSEVDQMRKVAQEDIDERKKVVIASETKLDNREAALDKREDAIITRETQIDEKRNEYEQRLQALDVKDKDLQAKIDSIIVELQKVANMSLEQAKDELMARVEEKEAKRIALYKEQMEEEAQSQAEDKAKTLMALAMEKYAQDATCERNSSAVALPSDEMKGRIIGREGRNIKSMEQLFGVSLIIDDTPETLTVSCFDPIRREKAKLTLEALIRDGRIQPGRIEDLYQKISDEFDESLKRIGEQTVFKLGLPRISSGLLMYIGRLKYRTSYG
jgi:ribonuclease Y